MLARDEFDQRVGQTFAVRTYIDLATLTADLPAGLAAGKAALSRPPVTKGERPMSKKAGAKKKKKKKKKKARVELYFTISLIASSTLFCFVAIVLLWGLRSPGGGRSVPAGIGRRVQHLARAVSHPGACHRQVRAGSFLRLVTVTGTPPKRPEAIVILRRRAYVEAPRKAS